MGNRIFDKLADTDLLARSPILVFAADPLASAGIKGLGQVQHPKPHYRTHAEVFETPARPRCRWQIRRAPDDTR